MPISNISDNYTITNYTGSLSENRVRDPANDAAGTAATGSINILTSLGANLAGDTITLIDWQGLEKTYIFHNDSAGATGTLDGSQRVRVQLNGLSSFNYNFSLQLKNAIIGSSGHNGTITVENNGSDGFLGLTQSFGTADGNKTIASSIGGGGFEAGQRFAGGVTGLTAYKNADVVPYKSSIPGAFNIRGQTTTSRYKVFLGEEKS